MCAVPDMIHPYSLYTYIVENLFAKSLANISLIIPLAGVFVEVTVDSSRVSDFQTRG